MQKHPLYRVLVPVSFAGQLELSGHWPGHVPGKHCASGHFGQVTGARVGPGQGRNPGETETIHMLTPLILESFLTI